MNHAVAPPRTSPALPHDALLTRLRLDDIKKTIWLTRPDLRDMVGDHRDLFELWLVLNGDKEYQTLAELGATMPEELLTEPAPEALPQVRPALTRFMKTLWSMRPDLYEAFDLYTAEGQQAFVWSYFVHGIGELKLARFLTPAQRCQLNEADPEFPSSGFLPVTKLMVEVWRRRPDLQQAFNIREPQGQDAFLVWYFTRGLLEFDLVEMVDDLQARVLLSPSSQSPLAARILSMLWSSNRSLQERFEGPADDGLHRWAMSEDGYKAYPLLRRLMELAGSPTQVAPAVRQASVDLPFGVNLIGYAKGQFGLGEDVRMAALALDAAGIPFTIYNVEPGREVCQGDHSALKHFSDTLPYAVNIFCTTGIETARLAAVYGSQLFDGRRSIGYWPWELPEWPAEWRHAYDLVDEVWASSRYTYEAYLKTCPKPVRHMPIAVTVDATAGLGRCDFGLPEDRFLFVFSFDVLSGMARKNPEACVRAFRRAFPRGDEPVGLVVKAMRAVPGNPVWEALLAEVRADNRISIIDGTLSRGAVLDLYRACDCFVSLHRAEGFGRGIAEALMLGKTVVVTGWSGNMDFTTEETAALVNYRLRLVEEGEYPFARGMLWADPDVEQAAEWMWRLADDRELRQRVGESGCKLTTAVYAPVAIGREYAAVLDQEHS